MAEQGTHKPLVGGSNPPSATNTDAGRAALAAVLREGADTDPLMPPHASIVLAVSGGPDSMALLAGAVTLAPALGWRLVVAHLDHGLRPEAPADAAFVRAAALAEGLAFVCQAVDVRRLARERGQSIEEAARDARYAFLDGVAADLADDALIATAHTADDNAETILLNIGRGSGIGGLRGIPRRRGRIVRPLLGVRRAELHRLAAEAGVRSVSDSTNDDDRFLRARVRAEVLPALERLNPSAVEALLRLARVATDDDLVLHEIAAAELERRRLSDPRDSSFRLDWHEPPPRAIGRRVVRLALGTPLRMERVEALLDAAEGARGGVRIELGAGRWADVRGRVIAVGPANG